MLFCGWWLHIVSESLFPVGPFPVCRASSLKARLIVNSGYNWRNSLRICQQRNMQKCFKKQILLIYIVYLLDKYAYNEMHAECYEGCPENIQPFWISLEPVAWPWCNLAASQRRPHCASVNSHSPVGLVSRQQDAVDWACVLYDGRIHNNRANRSASSRKCACPFYSSRAGFFFFWQSITSPWSVNPPTALIWLPATSGFSQS
jgi:hypothetical protein